MGEAAERFTDYVLTIEGGTSEEVFSFLDRVVVPTLQHVTELDVGLASHTCNDDGDTYHSVLARNEILAERLEELLAERLEAIAGVEPLRLVAMGRLLLDSGDITPMGARMLEKLAAGDA